MKTIHIFNRLPVMTVLVATGCFLISTGTARAAEEENFSTPDDAVKAFTTAGAKKDTNALEVIFGPGFRELVSADPVQASNGLQHLSGRVTERANQVQVSDSFIGLELGVDAWPFPIALIKQAGQWHFDTEGGKDEILNRRIGRNELNTIRVCRAFVQAQREYASEDHTGSGVLEYAQHLRSTPGKHDGLYWHAEPGGEISPLGPLVAAAHEEGYSHTNKILTEKQVPYQGYYFKILTRQGSHAACGKYDYIINGHMIGGFALVAWPAEWGNSGVMTFIINQEGKVFEKNLGPNTTSIAAKMMTYDPSPGWKPPVE